ncbi:MAG: hypothetical protein R3F24_00265 [Gammaproteobacteria bacterium]
MKLFRTNRTPQAGAFSLSNAQIYVGEVSKNGGPPQKGMSIAGSILGPLPAERAFALSTESAVDLVRFFDQLLDQKLPSSVSTRINFLETAYWRVKKFDSEWHHGGGFIGGLAYGGLFGGSAVSATISKKATKEFRECLVKLYKIAA